MSEKFKHSEQLNDILRYLNDSMTNEERYTFERELERDPFMQEAFEGLSGIRSSDIEKDIRRLDIMSGKKRKLIIPFRYVAYAAGFALLILAGFWISQSIDFSRSEMAETKADSMNILLTEPYKPEITDTIDSSASMEAGSPQIAVVNKASNNNLIAQATPAKTTALQAESTSKEVVKKKVVMKDTGKQAVPVKQAEGDVPVTTADLTFEAAESAASSIGIEANREDLPEPEAVLKRPGVNANPEPLGGNSLFKDYIDKNIKYPDGIQNAKREFVKLKFKVSKTGDPTGFVILKSPDDQFSKEAIRLIQSGPRWSPEIKDGIPVEGEVTLRINFKP